MAALLARAAIGASTPAHVDPQSPRPGLIVELSSPIGSGCVVSVFDVWEEQRLADGPRGELPPGAIPKQFRAFMDKCDRDHSIYYEYNVYLCLEKMFSI